MSEGKTAKTWSKTRVQNLVKHQPTFAGGLIILALAGFLLKRGQANLGHQEVGGFERFPYFFTIQTKPGIVAA